MKDPYSVLGVGRSDSLDEIKKTYRELARKYHPDNYVGNALADLAQEKMKEINEAYDTILKERENGPQSNPRWSGPNASGGNYGNIRNLIIQGEIEEAERLLSAISNRDAEWYFLMGSVLDRKGWHDEAARHWQTAVSMNPTNQEYRQAYQYTRNSPFGDGYRQPRAGGNVGGCSPCDICSALMCADCLCDCC